MFNLLCDTQRDNHRSAKSWSNIKLFFIKEAVNTKHHNTGLVGLNYEAANVILQLRDAFAAQQQEIVKMGAVQEQPVNSTSEYKDLRLKLDELMAKINSTKLHHQE